MAHALIFDSGVGGLSVAADIGRRLPDLHMTYVADDAFRPYGNKTEAQLNARLPDLLRPLYDMLKPDIIVIACNTASTTALPYIRKALPCLIVGVVPAVKPAAQISQTHVIGVLGTPGTVKRRYVDGLIREFAADKTVYLAGSVTLVELAERKLSGEIIDPNWIKPEILPLFKTSAGPKLDTVVLACTHFPLLKPELEACAPWPVNWIDSGDAIARRVETVLKESNFAPPILSMPRTAFITSLHADSIRQRTFRDYGFERLVCLGP